MMKKVFSVAIDGPAGAGKSTIARHAAKDLGFVYVDTGAIYRTVAYAAVSQNIEPSDASAVEQLLPQLTVIPDWQEDGIQHMLLNGMDVTSQIREPEISSATSKISAIPAVRQFLLNTQRDIAKSHSVIMDGRDIGTVVLPDADVKIFLSASAEVRAQRRFAELLEKETAVTYDEIYRQMVERDERDSKRAVAPLRRAEDAILLDTSSLTLEESISETEKIIRKKLKL